MITKKPKEREFTAGERRKLKRTPVKRFTAEEIEQAVLKITEAFSVTKAAARDCEWRLMVKPDALTSVEILIPYHLVRRKKRVWTMLPRQLKLPVPITAIELNRRTGLLLEADLNSIMGVSK